MENSESDPEYEIIVDLSSQRVWDTNEDVVAEFDIEPFRKHCLLNGLDDIGLTLENESDIQAYESSQSRS